MQHFKIVPLGREYADKIRSSMKDDFGHTVTEQLSHGRGPCRVSLKPFETGKDIRLVFAHSPFDIDNAFNQCGPIFIHKEVVEPYADIYRFPPEIKADKKNTPLTLVGYNTLQQMVYARQVSDKDVDEMIVSIFNKHPEVEYLHARNAEACCYICRIERV